MVTAENPALPAVFVGASEDGSKVFFMTKTELTKRRHRARARAVRVRNRNRKADAHLARRIGHGRRQRRLRRGGRRAMARPSTSPRYGALASGASGALGQEQQERHCYRPGQPLPLRHPHRKDDVHHARSMSRTIQSSFAAGRVAGIRETLFSAGESAGFVGLSLPGGVVHDRRRAAIWCSGHQADHRV